MSDRQSEQRPSNRNLRPWVKGQSGNPGGRPKGIEARAREYTEEALAVLVAAMSDPDPRTRIAAASALLDRGWGKAKQTVAGDPDKPVYVVYAPPPVANTQEWLRRYAPEGAAELGEIIEGEAEDAAPEWPAQKPPEPVLAPPPPPAASVSQNSSDLPRARWLTAFNRGGRDYR